MDQVSGKVGQAIGKVNQSVGETVCNEKLRKRTTETAAPARCPDRIVSAIVIFQQLFDFSSDWKP